MFNSTILSTEKIEFDRQYWRYELTLTNIDCSLMKGKMCSLCNLIVDKISELNRRTI